ncbi:anion permease [Haladaptatus sp. NG-SE-30]
MADLVTVVPILIAILSSAFMAWVLGAGSSGATPFAPAVGANAISILRAAFVVGILGFAGAAIQGGNVSEAVGSGLVTGVTLTPMAVIVALLTGAGLMAIGIYAGIPIATAFTVTGAVIGVGLALGGTPAWEKYRVIAALWLLTPVVGGGLAYGIASLLPRKDVPERISIPVLGALVGLVVANIDFTFLGPNGEARSLAESVAVSVHVPTPAARVVVTLVVAVAIALVLRWDIERDEAVALRRFLLALGGLVAFAAGGSQVGLAVGPLLPLLDGFAVPTVLILVGGGVGLLIGSWTGAPRMIQALSREYSSLGPRRSIAALIPSFLIAQTAVLLGVPISFNEVIVSAIVGSGAAVGGNGNVESTKLLKTVGAWAGSFVVAFAVGYGVFIVALL